MNELQEKEVDKNQESPQENTAQAEQGQAAEQGAAGATEERSDPKPEEDHPKQDSAPEEAKEPAVEEPPPEQKPAQELRTLYVSGSQIKTSLELPFLAVRHPAFSVGDTLSVNFLIREGNKERIQTYAGVVIAIRGEGLGKSFIVRRVSHEVGVERIFPYYSPAIESVKVLRRGKVRRSRLYYLRSKSGKAGRIKEYFDKGSAKAQGKAGTKTGAEKKEPKKKRLSKKVSKKKAGGKSSKKSKK